MVDLLAPPSNAQRLSRGAHGDSRAAGSSRRLDLVTTADAVRSEFSRDNPYPEAERKCYPDP